jgi:diguanylate cyclase (GGDEF)-like protein
MKFFEASISAIWRQRVIGSAASYVIYFLLHLTETFVFSNLILVVLIGSLAVYLLVFFTSSPAWVRWTLAVADVVSVAFMLSGTGGVQSPFVMIIPVWFIGIALTNLVDGNTKPIPWMLLMALLAYVVGGWGTHNIFSAVVSCVALGGMGGAALTLSLERHASLHDPFLSNLFNRAAGLERLEELCNSDAVISVAFVDLRDFKGFNDKFGHKVGDEVLLEVAKRLKSSVRRSDLTVRMGGDEFLVASQHPDLQTRLEQIFTSPVKTSKGELLVSGDIGSVSVSRHDEIDQILERADVLMYSRKRAAKLATT